MTSKAAINHVGGRRVLIVASSSKEKLLPHTKMANESEKKPAPGKKKSHFMSKKNSSELLEDCF